MYDDFIRLVRSIYSTNEKIFLHEPRFIGNEKKYLNDVVDSTFVSSVGKYVDKFETAIGEYTGSNYCVASVNGTSALHLALKVCGVRPEVEVLTQSFTFVATCNAIDYCGAYPVFVDVDKDTLSLSPEALEKFLNEHCELREDQLCWNRTSNRVVQACLPMHTYGFPAEILSIKEICKKYNISLIEDAAESLGSKAGEQHTGTFGQVSVLSFNGNKVITTGGGGMLMTDDELLADKARHLSTTGRIKNDREFSHDVIAYNYRMPNVNAALGCAQLEQLPEYLSRKRDVASAYIEWGENAGIKFIKESRGTNANYWLNTMIAEDLDDRNKWLEKTNNNMIETRPAWKPMHLLPMYRDCQHDEMENTLWLYERVINVPSSVPVY